MNEFTISQLEQFSGVKAHTIRVWEQRYNALNPNRTNSNKRTYSGDELRRLLNIVSLIEADIKVSKVCTMSDEDIAEHLAQELKTNEENKSNQDYYINQLISAGITYDDYNFEKIFSSCILRLGLIDTMIKVIYPLLGRIGLLWQSGKFPPGQEHFMSNIISQKLHVAIDSLPIPQPTSEKWLLFLPENEFHEISLLLCNYIIKQAGKKVIYLGKLQGFTD